ncbi:apolipoprotein N-acyltransferase [Paucidesulfovibrio gracilis DSM 16080]|uniref:Apolipoprotein N-acyltransferase n=1 Tax=Paucidesulfovibrio gracilis DSM 16080 TaxID=1121449 RepID=A0A1T4WM77_9BACT|nr:apolipoprotein N-acyltransferase [Paucidesulfovibrio gracilis]SKA78442.1 apolipoprotein N-acyltransferase [Paucidesulfovibrio gracilis DSM 16080]
MPLLCLLAVVGALLGYPNPWFHFPPAILLFPLSLGLIAFRAGSPIRAFGWTYLTGVLAHCACLYWVAGPVAEYGGLPWWLALPCPIGVSLVMGLYNGVFGWAMHRGARRLSPIFLCLFGGSLWAALEQTGAWFLSGFPWVTLSTAFADWPLLIQPAALIGAYGLSGLFAATGLALALWNTARSPRILLLFVAIFVVGFGAYRMAGFTQSGTGKTIALIQGNIDQGHKWQAPYQISTVKKYLDLSQKALLESSSSEGTTKSADLVVWPETAMPFYFQDAGVYGSQVVEFVNHKNVPLLLGSPAYRSNTDGSYTFFNRAFLLTPNASTMQWYDKVHLVPFGEYVPLKDWLPFDKLTQEAGDYQPGTRLAPLKTDGMHLGVLICYEAIFPGLAQDRVSHGADILINISNDAWFGRSSAPWQHLAQTQMRAVEQGRWIARGTNTGITAFIDPLGRIPARTSLFSDQILTWTVKPVQVTTMYHKIYAWLYWGIYAFSGLLLVWIALSPAIRRS